MNKIQKAIIESALIALSEELSDAYEYINCGGCGLMAAIVGKELEKIGIPCEVIAKGNPVDKTRYTIQDKKNMLEWESIGVDFGHLALRLKLGRKIYSWDSNGLWDGSKNAVYCTYPFGKGLTVRECNAVASSKFGWNEMFDRKKVPALKKIVAKNFKDLRKSLRNAV